jgi:hypothetical protein
MCCARPLQSRPPALLFWLILAYSPVWLACGGGTELAAPAGPVASVTVSASAVSLAKGQTLQLVPILRDKEGKDLIERAVSWTSRMRPGPPSRLLV